MKTPLSQAERLVAIRRHLQQRQRISLDEICHQFGVSKDSARRDLVKLTEADDIVRIRGGALLATPDWQPNPYLTRRDHRETKYRLGQLAAQQLTAVSTLLLDTSSTVEQVAAALPALPDPVSESTEHRTVITNSMDIAQQLGPRKDITLHLLGGQFDPWQRSLIGPHTRQQLADFHGQVAVLGICALGPQGLMASSLEEAKFKQQMIHQSQKVLVVGDHSKFEQHQGFLVCPLAALDTLVTDRLPSGPLAATLSELDIEVITLTDASSTDSNSGTQP